MDAMKTPPLCALVNTSGMCLEPSIIMAGSLNGAGDE